ncbi:DNA-directed RNA polymerase subunit alpha C-terminal domain-containing protein [Sphingobacterium thalpophilum]|uniref:DNA-directed RNA polymerase subunit alpha C-terminal domain-containing protein n=1 Tax=Sphingobacterium thalpophilum TaxID=259 RepID=UPI003C76A92D
MNRIKTKRTCPKGHHFYKSTDCPTCPICEKEKKTDGDFLEALSSPARNALLNHGVDDIEKLAQTSEAELLKLHGFGKASLPLLRQILQEHGLTFSR